MAKSEKKDFSDQRLEMLYTAQSFYAATVSLYRAVYRENGKIDDTRMIPYVTIEALTAELYLKVLHQMDNGETPTKIHNLKKLFDGLLKQTQDEILELATLPVTNYTKEEFMRALETSSNRFTEFRYFFESHGENRVTYYRPLHEMVNTMKTLIEHRLGPLVDFITPDFIQVRAIENEVSSVEDQGDLENQGGE